METGKDFTHFNEQGRARMVNVGEKDVTRRNAVATGKVLVSRDTLELIKSGGMKKGDVLTVAQVAGIMGAKKTPEVIAMCHPVQIDGTDLSLELDEEECAVKITARVSCSGKTGVEMEALTAASVALLTIYDMCKALSKSMTLGEIRLERTSGGKSGLYVAGEN